MAITLDEALQQIIDAVVEDNPSNANTIYHLNQAKLTAPMLLVELQFLAAPVAEPTVTELPGEFIETGEDYGLPEAIEPFEYEEVTAPEEEE